MRTPTSSSAALTKTVEPPGSVARHFPARVWPPPIGSQRSLIGRAVARRHPRRPFTRLLAHRRGDRGQALPVMLLALAAVLFLTALAPPDPVQQAVPARIGGWQQANLTQDGGREWARGLPPVGAAPMRR